ncbi:glycoside hydrolase family 65 protein [Vibrio sp. JC009]|uniref:glycoside hydrolase family 65 protein n=1 Tax=Vibrio sp. JC009 TaxID=2912314 RepID=UPI0023B0377B|nr:glycosyl hydrolase family 65 protein [Vibrio sp. JC009]WED24624.1 glycoside hydrolase family 65 protein [Vibrio sp. JC009]
MFMNYSAGQGELKNWIVEETAFDSAFQGKCEVVMSQGNGYMGTRSATEEKYVGQVRNTFIAGTFNKFDENEVTELPNAADMSAIEIFIDGRRFHLETGEVSKYSRRLNVKNGELIREFNWTNSEGKTFAMRFRRFISQANLHLMAFQVEVTPVDCEATVEIRSGVDAQLSNTGAQHFHEGEKRIYDKRFIELLQHTTESKVDFVFITTHRTFVDGIEEVIEPVLQMDRRKVWVNLSRELKAGETLTTEKTGVVHTSRDKAFDVEGYELQALRGHALENIKASAERRFDELLADSAVEWDRRWDGMNITIGGSDFDQLAIRFAQYQLNIFTPMHDSRFGIGAKGLSGEGYKGHSFWDTEVFMLPFFIYTMPEVARSLLEYRFKTLDGARKKASDNGYIGAQFPWESALTGEEVTPVWGAVDIITGKSTKIWSGFIEQHITCDITYALWQYYQITGDQKFMDEMGYEIMFDTATFWTSRLEWLEEREMWGICNVIGPDEYKEHIDNNAFTNYMVVENIRLAIRYYDDLAANNPELLAALSEKLDLEQARKMWLEKVEDIYLPQPREEDKVIPQDDTYLQKEVIDLTKYKEQPFVGGLFQDYNLEQVNEMQVSKQADLMVLFLQLEDKFDLETKLANWNYYEPKTLHDSSLSLSTHSVLASDVGNPELSYDLFSQAAAIDIGQNMKSSDHGIHAASIGGMWQCVVYGFGGVRMLGGKLRIKPNLPESWDSLNFPIYWKGERLEITVDGSSVRVERPEFNGMPVEIEIAGQPQLIEATEATFNV